MPSEPHRTRFDEVTQQWRALAERRLAYYTELYRSGRWKHYYSEERFAMRMLDVIRAVRMFSRLTDAAPAAKPSSDRRTMRPAA